MTKRSLLATLQQWVETNSYSKNSRGLDQMKRLLLQKYRSLEGAVQDHRLETPHGHVSLLTWKKRPSAPHQVLFGGHYDTVFSPDSPFQKMKPLSSSRNEGPGILDMKSGLLMIWMILDAIERSPWKEKIGWKVLLNPDEEIGSIYSKDIMEKEALGYDFALWFEPALNQATLIHKRAASMNLQVAFHGKKAHVGRNFHEGRSAIEGLVVLLHEMARKKSASRLINIGEIEGGSGLNTVAEEAKARVNIRSFSEQTLVKFQESMERKGKALGEKMELTFTMEILSFRSAKPFTPANQRLFKKYIDFAKEKGIFLQQKESFGVTDSASLGKIACIDSLGAIGQGLHTHSEWVDIDSLFTRGRLTLEFLQKVVQS